MAVNTKDESPVTIPMSERTGKGKRIYDALKSGAKTINEIAKITKLPASSIQVYINDHENDFIEKNKNHRTIYCLQN